MGLFGMGLFDNDSFDNDSFDTLGQNKTMETFLKIAILHELGEMGKQGADISIIDWKAIHIARKAAGVELGMPPEELENITNIGKLEPYKACPRSVDSNFVFDVAGKLPMFGKSKRLARIAEGKLVYTAVVQANSYLWSPGEKCYLTGVFVFAMDDDHCCNVEWLKETAKKIVVMKNTADVPQDCRKLILELRDRRTAFCFKLSSSISGSADAWCAVLKIINQVTLPKQCLPSDGVVPFLVCGTPKHNYSPRFIAIPAKYYS